MINPITLRSHTRRSMALSALVVCAGTLWANATAHAQTTPAVYAVMDQSRFAIEVEIRILPGCEAEFLALIRQRVAHSRSDSAVVDFRILSTSDSLVFRAFETYTDEADLRAFAASASSADFGQRLKPLLAAPLSATLLRPLP